jgi:hypothetical protein
MDSTNVILLLIAVAVVVALVVHFVHVKWPAATVKSVVGVVRDEAIDLEAAAEADAVNALTRVVAWATDKSGEQAKIAQATAAMARKDAMRAHAAAMLSGTDTKS